MHVASLELCKELYELSGWDDCDNWASHKDMAFISDDTFLEMNSKWQKEAPAYDLGYLLRKLPEGTHITKAFMSGVQTRHQYNATAKTSEEWHTGFEADTPEDCAAKLAIELFKQNILTNELEG